MRPVAILATLLLATRACCAETAPDAAAIKAAIERLGSDDFADREAASDALVKMGDPITPLLQSAIDKSHDAETRQRLETLVARWPVGGLVWKFEAGYVFGLPVVDGNRVYIGNKDMNFFCLDLESGKEIWKTPIEGMMFHSPAVADGRVYVIRTRKNGDPDGTLICLNAKDGSQLWTFHSTDSQTFTSPMVRDGKLYLVNDDVLFCLDAATGKKLWEYQAPKTILSAPSIADGWVLIGSLDHSIHCVSAESGQHLWSYESGDSIYAGASIAKGRAYVGGNDKNVYCLDLKTGAKLWQYEGDGRIASAPAYANERLYYGGDSGVVTCLNAASGERVWEFKVTGMVTAAPSVFGSRVYFVAIYDRMTAFCLNADDGKPLWSYSIKEAGYATPVLAGRRLLLGYCSSFYCVRTGAPGPDHWPMTGGNAARTGVGE